jgi:hypothetical protein
VKKCKRFPSQEYAASKARRLRRIGARATPELSEAFAAGKITLRQYDLVSRLAPKQQRVKIDLLNRKIRGAKIAAEAIERLLGTNRAAGQVQLSEVARTIREAVAGSAGPNGNSHWLRLRRNERL